MINIESLPYFGKINSISRIVKIKTEDDKYYLIKRYNANGNEKKEDFIVPINLKNTRGILEDYCKDLKDYLAKNETKYNELRKKKKIFNINLSLDTLNLCERLSKIGICLGTILIGLTFSILSIQILFWTGMIVLITSGVGMLVINDISKELDENKFVTSYDEYSRKLNEFKSCLDNKMKNKLTEYNGLSHEKNKGNSLKMKKIKTLNKVA